MWALPLIVATILFITGLLLKDLNGVIVHTLEFYVLFKVVRGLTDVLQGNEARAKMRYAMEAGISFLMLETYIVATNLRINSADYTSYMAFGAFIAGVLVLALIRGILIKQTTNKFE